VITKLKNTKTKLSNDSLYICTALLCFLLIFICSYYNTDPDFGWHLASGKYIITKGIPRLDIFTYTASNFPWINHEWLNDVFVASLYGIGGYLLTAFFYSCVWITSLILAQRHYLKSVLLLSTLALLPFMGIRPNVWSVLFLVILERLVNSDKRKYAYLIPVLFIFWANFHGSFVLGLVILLLYQFFGKKKMPWVVIIASFCSVFINPYGPRIFDEIIRTALDVGLKNKVNEWRPIIIPGTMPILPIFYIILLVAFDFISVKKPWRSLFSIPGLLLLMTFTSIRHMPLFVVASSRHMESFMLIIKDKFKNTKLDKSRTIVAALLFTVLWSTTTYLSVGAIHNTINQAEYVPSKAVSYIKSHPCQGNIFNSYDLGGYLIWKLPEYKVYIDGRMPSWKLPGNDYFNNWSSVIYDDSYRRYQEQLYNIKCMVLTRSNAFDPKPGKMSLYNRLIEEGWEISEEGSSPQYVLMLKLKLKPNP